MTGTADLCIKTKKTPKRRIGTSLVKKSSMMKNAFRFLGVIAFVMAIGFLMTTCDTTPKPDPREAYFGTWEISREDYQDYTLTIAAKSVYFAKQDNSVWMLYKDAFWSKATPSIDDANQGYTSGYKLGGGTSTSSTTSKISKLFLHNTDNKQLLMIDSENNKYYFTKQ